MSGEAADNDGAGDVETVGVGGSARVSVWVTMLVTSDTLPTLPLLLTTGGPLDPGPAQMSSVSLSLLISVISPICDGCCCCMRVSVSRRNISV